MIAFVWNIFLALAWAAATERFTPSNLIIGFVIGYGLLAIMPPLPGAGAYYLQMREMFDFARFFAKEVIVSNLRVAYFVVAPLSKLNAGVIAVPLEDMTDAELTILANMITLTPGTLSLDISDDRRTLYIHTMYIGEPEQFRRTIREEYARRVIEVMR